MADVVSVPGNALVLRFSPTQPDSVLRSAVKEFRRDDHYGCSVFAAIPSPVESDEEVIQRLLVVSELGGVDPDRNRKFFICGAARNLQAENFVFMKDGYTGELAEHYCVNLGDEEPDLATVQRFLDQFDRTERR